MTLHTGTAGPPIRANNFEPEVLRQILLALVPMQGVVGVSDLAVTQNGTPNMSVNVASGFAVVKGTSSVPTQGSYPIYNDATVNLTIAASDPTNPRIDVVYIGIQDAFYTGATNTPVLTVATGTPNASPVAPSIPVTCYSLAQVRVDAGVTSIVTAKITDTRTTIGSNPSFNQNANSVGATRILGSANKWTPAGGPYNVGDIVKDYGYMGEWVCTVAGSPGTWKLMGGGRIHATMTRVAAQSIPNSTATRIQYDTSVDDPLSLITLGATAVVTVPVTGLYLLEGLYSSASNAATAAAYVGIYFINAAAASVVQSTISFTSGIFAPWSTLVQLTAGQTVYGGQQQNTGGAVNTGSPPPYFSVQYLGPA